MKLRRMLLLAVAALVIWGAPVMAFHDDGVAHCDGCHTMHNSENGEAVVNGRAPGWGYDDLLTFANASDVCLNCHGGARSYNVFTDNPLDPGLSNYYSAGNFVFLLEDNINDGHRGASNPISGDASGHNIKSGIKMTDWDQTLTAPPSSGPSPLTNNQIQCSSCHDPHGNDGFRLLYQEGQQVEVGGDVVTFLDTVEAWGISYGDVETDAYHNVYKDGYSSWCSSCHSNFHQRPGRNIHPSGIALGSDIAIQYNRYRGTTDCVTSGVSPCGTGTSDTAYLADVPFEFAGAVATDITSTAGPNSNARVSCVSCHRAHATSAENAGRWDFSVTLLIEDGDESGSWEIPNSFDDNQRSLCNKCHGQDEFDHITVAPPPAP